MSLTNEAILLKEAIKKLERKKIQLELDFDVYNTSIRQETSPLLKIDQIDAKKILRLAEHILNIINDIHSINTEITVLNKKS